MNRLKRREANQEALADMERDRLKQRHDDEECSGPGPGECEFCEREWDEAIEANQKIF